MYTPPAFRIEDLPAIQAAIRSARIATLVTSTAEGPTATPLPIMGDRGFTVAEATAGGIPLTEVRLETMESRISPGLHFAGEVLDIDGVTGGFNFQSAWTTGWLAGQGMGAFSA